ncbi:MAG: DUF6483 family protein [Clostridia bacterium]|nr:DUF6483 family protein [Clostridia bacterium]
MYFQEDTILRMIEQLGAAYRQLMRLLNDLEAEGELNKVFQQLTGLDRNTAKLLPVDSLTDMLTPERRMALCELMLMEADRFAHRLDTDEIQTMRHRALMLLCGIDIDEIAILRAPLAKQLFDQCADVCTCGDTVSLLCFLRIGGAYATAEDVLFLQLEAFARPEDIRTLLAEGEAFYSLLLAEPDDGLVKGGLPREEVLQGQAALKSHGRGGP